MTEKNDAVARRKDHLSGLLSKESFQNSLRDVLPKHLTPERIVKMALVAASRQPKLYECTDASIVQAIMKSGELGLDCTGTLGQGYLVPYFNSKIKKLECQFIAGYQGLINLARRSGNIKRIESRVVYEADTFSVDYGTDQSLTHKPYLGDEDKGNIVCVYAIAEMVGGGTQIEIMTLAEVQGIQGRSKAGKSGPWSTDFSEMARKTVIRRIAKYLPLSPELETALVADDAQFDFAKHGAATASVAAGSDALKGRLRKDVESKDVTPEPTEESIDEPIEDTPPQLQWYCSKCEKDLETLTDNGLCPTCLTNKNIIDREKSEIDE